MKEVVKRILPDIKSLTQSLSRKALFVNQPWVIINNDGRIEKLIFKKNNELVMSSDGKVIVGRWEYLAAANSLLIDRIEDKILLNQEFVDEAIMVMSYDGNTEKLFILANENIIPDLNIERYLKNLFYDNYNVLEIEATDNRKYEIVEGLLNYSSESIKTGLVVLKNLKKVDDTVFTTKGQNLEINYYIRNSKIFKKSRNKIVKVKTGEELNVEVFFNNNPFTRIKKGDKVKIGNSTAPDGVYKLGFLRKIKVRNGIVV